MTSSDLESFMEEYDGRIDDIAEIFLVPRDLIGNPTYDSTQPIRRVTQSVGATLCGWIQVVRPATIDNYTPKNNKLLVYPYQYLLVDNNAGGSAEFYYELFKNPSLCKFNIQGVLTPGTSRVLVPEDYAYGITGITGEMYNYGLSLGKFPICNWTTDVYTNWLTQNGVNMQWNLISSIGSGAISGAKTGGITGGIGGAVGGGINGVINNMLEKRQHSFSPNQAKGNANSGDVMTSLYANMPYFLKMSIKQEYAKQIDSYFSMFGYQTNRLGKPHLTARTYYDYIKTVDINLEGNVPEPDLNQIRNMFNNGIRFWHDTTKYLDFSVNNTIVT